MSTTITDTIIMTTVAPSAANVFSVANVMKWIYLVVGILGLIDNAFVMCIILRSRPLRQHPRNWLIFNQSLADFCGAVMVTAVTFRTISKDLQGAHGWLMCTIWYSNALLWICYVSSEYILLTLTCEVYMAIVHPVTHKNIVTTHRLVVIVIIIWLSSTAFHIAYNMSTAAIINGNCFTGKIWATPNAPIAFSIFSVSVKYFVPLIVFAYCYIGMAISLKRNKVGTAQPVTEHAHQNGGTGHPSGSHDRAIRNIYYTLSYSLVSHVLAWSTNQIQFLIRGFGVVIDANSLYVIIGILTIYAGCLVNPIIYIIKYERFRSAVRKELASLLSYFGFKHQVVADVSEMSSHTHKTATSTF